MKGRLRQSWFILLVSVTQDKGHSQITPDTVDINPTLKKSHQYQGRQLEDFPGFLFFFKTWQPQTSYEVQNAAFY